MVIPDVTLIVKLGGKLSCKCMEDTLCVSPRMCLSGQLDGSKADGARG